MSSLRKIIAMGMVGWGLSAAAPANAGVLPLVSSGMLVLFQSAGNQCLLYSYDLNGNRLARNAVPFVAGGLWGSSTYGCFTWTAS